MTPLPLKTTVAEHWLAEMAPWLDRINCGVIGRNRDSQIVFVNTRLLNWTGHGEAELIGEDVARLFPPELRERTHTEVRASTEGDLRARLSVMQRRDSTTFPVLIIPQTFEGADGEYAGIVSIIVDLATIETAKRVASGPEASLASRLDRLAGELQSLSISASIAVPTAVSLDHPELASLSTREAEVLSLLMSGQRVPSIARRLHISPHTVRNHLKSMFRKLEVGTQVDLIEFVRELGKPVSPDAAGDEA
jgi:PAS domain S-box-containing protein